MSRDIWHRKAGAGAERCLAFWVSGMVNENRQWCSILFQFIRFGRQCQPNSSWGIGQVEKAHVLQISDREPPSESIGMIY
jgi:hypothetical protein